jgi:hypothetical protein
LKPEGRNRAATNKRPNNNAPSWRRLNIKVLGSDFGP